LTAKTKKVKKGTLLIEVAKCVACKSCELACAIEHSKSKKVALAIYEKPLSKSRIRVKNKAGVSVPSQCRHCKGAPCIKVCPPEAIKRKEENGPVLIDEKLCTGCKKCIKACPFDAIVMNKATKKAIKCDLCIERTKKGEDPACVIACPTKALQFKTLKDTVGLVKIIK